LIEKAGPFIMPFKKKELIRMAKSNLAVVESSAEQAVVEPEKPGLTANPRLKFRLRRKAAKPLPLY